MIEHVAFELRTYSYKIFPRKLLPLNGNDHIYPSFINFTTYCYLLWQNQCMNSMRVQKLNTVHVVQLMTFKVKVDLHTHYRPHHGGKPRRICINNALNRQNLQKFKTTQHWVVGKFKILHTNLSWLLWWRQSSLQANVFKPKSWTMNKPIQKPYLLEWMVPP